MSVRRQIMLLAFLLGSAFFVTGPARSQDATASFDLLSRTQAATEHFFSEFALIRYEEDVSQQKIRSDGKVEYRQDTVFDSIMRMRFEENQLLVDEQQIMEGVPKRVESRPLLSTRGFSALAMIFHPYYGSDFHFELDADEQWQGKALARIKFEHIPDKPSPWLYQIFGGDRPLELSGTAWVDPATGEIFRIRAAVVSNTTDWGVKDLRAELTYAPVLLVDESFPRILPQSATIDLETPRQHWRNTYSFRDFRRYRVSTSVPGATPR